MLAIDSPNDAACRNARGVWDVKHFNVPSVNPLLVDSQLLHETFTSPVITVGDVINLAVSRHSINGKTTVLIADVYNNFTYKLAGAYDIVSFC